MHKPTDSLDQCLGTKAETLKKIYGHMRTAKVLPQFTFTAGEWQSHSAGMISKFQNRPKQRPKRGYADPVAGREI